MNNSKSKPKTKTATDCSEELGVVELGKIVGFYLHLREPVIYVLADFVR